MRQIKCYHGHFHAYKYCICWESFAVVACCFLCESFEMKIVCFLLPNCWRSAFVKIFMKSWVDLCQTIAGLGALNVQLCGQCCHRTHTRREKSLIQAGQRPQCTTTTTTAEKRAKETFACMFMAFALYLLKANNKLSLFMPCHAHLTCHVCFFSLCGCLPGKS